MEYNPDTGIMSHRHRVLPSGKVSLRSGRKIGTPSRGGLRATIEYQPYSIHRLAWFYMTGEWPKHVIDHKDGDFKNNKWGNIRDVTRSQNNMNMRPRKVRKDGSVELKGVCKHRNKWVAHIGIAGRTVYLGVFNCPGAAHIAYVVAARKHHGQYARFA